MDLSTIPTSSAYVREVKMLLLANFFIISGYFTSLCNKKRPKSVHTLAINQLSGEFFKTRAALCFVPSVLSWVAENFFLEKETIYLSFHVLLVFFVDKYIGKI